jgi:hypothetical protein
MPNSIHLTQGISNLVSLITKTKLGLSDTETGKEKSQGQLEQRREVQCSLCHTRGAKASESSSYALADVPKTK